MTVSRTAFLRTPGPIAIAHRGGCGAGPGAAPPNTLAAFAQSVQAGCRYLETDVRASRDGVPFVFHDARLDRTTDGHGLLAARSTTELRRVRVGGREPLTELADLLGELPDAFVNIDVKDDATVEPTVRVLRRAGALDRVCLGSFSHGRLMRLRRLLPGVATSFSPLEVVMLALGATENVRAAGVRAGGSCVQVCPTIGGIRVVDPAFVRHAHDLDLDVHVWTVNDVAAMTDLLDVGVDGVMTDRLDLLLPLLRTRADGGR